MQRKYWQALEQHQKDFASSLLELFAAEPNRFQNFSLEACGILFDYSKQRLQKETLQLLMELARACNLDQARRDLFSGAKINQTEAQAALHTALRDSSKAPIEVDGKNIKPEIQAVLQKLETFSEEVRAGKRLGATGKPFKNVICLGIGGSELGPALLCQALKDYALEDNNKIQIYFVSNVDARTLNRLFKTLDPESSFCIISSKTFTTPETMQNAKAVQAWFKAALKTEDHSAKHLFAATAARKHALTFGILPENIFEFWPWVGGRYSVWSAVGLPAILSMGMKHFKEFLAGAEAMDQHFQTAPFEKNMPVLMGLISIWNRNFWNFPHQAIIPYDDGLEKLPAYIQQLEMESNGKSVNQQGETLSFATAPVIWGGVGCNGQHAYMQLLHQGTDIIPVDFFIGIEGVAALPSLQKLLLASCFAQSKALMEGKTYADNVKDDNTKETIINKSKYCAGNRPSSTFIYSKLSPKTLGSLLALLEHKVFVQGVIWGINSFDQWGVELGKVLAKDILKNLDKPLDDQSLQGTDSSTAGLLRFAFQVKKEKNAENV